MIDGEIMINPPIYSQTASGNQTWLDFPSSKPPFPENVPIVSPEIHGKTGRPDTGPVPIPWRDGHPVGIVMV